MRERYDNIIENNPNEEMCQEYTDLISLKTFSEMDDPVLTPYTGHIYDRMDIVRWIEEKGTDPIVRDKVLTESMLVSGLFVKQIYVEQENKHDKDIDKLIQGFTQKIEASDISHKKDIDEMRSMMQMIIDQNIGLKTKNQEETQKNNQQDEEIIQLRQENEYLKKNYMNPIWSEFGEIIDKKLKKGSAPERIDALRAYASKVKSATSDEKLKDAINDTQALYNKDISEPRYLGWFFKTSETTKVAAQFQENVNKAKGWQ